MNYCKINGKAWDVIVSDITETFNITHSENAGRTIADGAEMLLDPLGTFFSHSVTFARIPGYEKEFDELFDFLSKPRSKGLRVELAHGQKTLAYDAYISTGSRSVKRIHFSDTETTVFWTAFSANFTPMKAQVLP